MFKWVDEAIVDEINMVVAKHSQLKEDVDSYKMYTTRRLENQAKQIEQTLHQLKAMMDAAENRHYTSSETRENSALTTEDTLGSPTRPSALYNPLTNIAIVAIVLGTLAWFYARISN